MTKCKKTKRKRLTAKDILYFVVNVIWYAAIAICFIQFTRGILIDINYHLYDNAFHHLASAKYDEELFSCECEVTNYYLNKIQKNYDLIPCEITDDFEAHGGSIIVKDQIPYTDSLERFDLSDEEVILGLYSPGNFCITLMYGEFNDTVIHEIGHFYSLTYGLSKSEDFKNVIDGEKEELSKLTDITYLTDFDEECYAEAFSIYFINPKKLEKSCPNTYKVIKSDIENASVIIENGGKK